jgi:hypothetical protein
VINVATGEPVSGALVEVSGEFQFSQSDGSFVFTNLPRGQFTVMPRKPGFFNDLELGPWVHGGTAMTTVPTDRDVIVKLTPEDIVFGQVKNENGDPLDGVTVRAQRRQVADGGSQLQSTSETTTDDEGNFRIAELPPGNYHLAFLPANRGGRIFTTLSSPCAADWIGALLYVLYFLCLPCFGCRNSAPMP